jgi:heptosyltransferase-3
MLKHIERSGRKRLGGLLRRLCVGRSVPLPKNPSSILVVRTDNRMGNLVLMEPLLRSLEQRFPDAKLVLLLSHVFAEMLECQGYSTITVDKKRQTRYPWEFSSLVRRLRKETFEVAIDASHPFSFSLSSAVITALSGAGARISTPSGNWEGWFTSVPGTPNPSDHESLTIHSLGSVWEDWPRWTAPSLTVDDVLSREAVGLHVGGKPGKACPPDRMRDIARLITDHFDLELYWGSETERILAEDLSGTTGAAVMPPMGLQEFMRSVAGLRAFVSADTGPMHVASALSIPVLALFRTDNVDRFAPLSAGSRSLLDPEGAVPEAVIAMLREMIPS